LVKLNVLITILTQISKQLFKPTIILSVTKNLNLK